VTKVRSGTTRSATRRNAERDAEEDGAPRRRPERASRTTLVKGVAFVKKYIKLFVSYYKGFSASRTRGAVPRA